MILIYLAFFNVGLAILQRALDKDYMLSILIAIFIILAAIYDRLPHDR